MDVQHYYRLMYILTSLKCYPLWLPCHNKLVVMEQITERLQLRRWVVQLHTLMSGPGHHLIRQQLKIFQD
ncbi:hypothetical protein D3C71_898700 [compost metagenome]